MWRVTLVGLSTDMDYEYWVEAPKGAARTDVKANAYRQHDKLWGAGVVAEGISWCREVKYLK